MEADEARHVAIRAVTQLTCRMGRPSYADVFQVTETAMRDDGNVELPLIELGADELEAVSGGESSPMTLFQTLSNCLRMIAETQKAIVANMRA
jgi:hypothetical protein